MTIAGELARSAIICPSHKVSFLLEEGTLKLTLATGAAMDRDFILEMENDSVQSLGVSAFARDTHVAMLTLLPPPVKFHEQNRDVVLVLDCSGSMQGDSLNLAKEGTVALVDEVEYGLEPHRLMRLLDSLGAKDATPPLQVFMTTHSPVTLRELAGNQLFVVRQRSGIHTATCAGTDDGIQGTLRKAAEAFLSKSVIVCEGASEVGFARGMDQWWLQCGAKSFLAHGGSYVDAGGGSPDQCFTRGEAFLKLGYRVLVFVDADKPVSTVGLVERFVEAGGQYLTWRPGLALEDELFRHSSNDAVHALLNKADEMVGRELMAEHVKSKSHGRVTLDAIEAERLNGGYTPESRALLGLAARNNKNGWFKSVSGFQEIAKDVVGPHIANAELGFIQIANQLWGWTSAST